MKLKFLKVLLISGFAYNTARGYAALSPLTVFRHLKPPPPNKSHAQRNQDMCVASIYEQACHRYYVDLAFVSHHPPPCKCTIPVNVLMFGSLL